MSVGTQLATPTNRVAVAELNAGSLRSNPLAFLTETSAFNHLYRIATGYSRSKLVPAAFQGKIDDCFIICQLAIRLQVDPFMLMQSTYVVHGKPGFEAKMAIALLNASGKIKGTIKNTFSGAGDAYGCRAWCIDRDTGEKIEGPKVDWKMVKAEGWSRKDGSKWLTMPDVMFVYRASTFLIRTCYPEVLMGMSTVDEIEDISPAQQHMEISNQERLELLLAGAPSEQEEKPTATTEPQQTAPQTTLEATSEPTQSEPPASATTDQDADVLSQAREDLSATTDPKAIVDWINGLPSLGYSLSLGETLVSMARARLRQLEPREAPKRSGKSSQASMLPPTAQEREDG